MSANPLPPCGTVRAYWRHRRLREPADQPCTDAWNAWRRDAPNRPPRQLAPCGTDAAYSRHKKRGEPIDQPCREAHATRNRLDNQANKLAEAIFGTTPTDPKETRA